jgi:hypothetical protein
MRGVRRGRLQAGLDREGLPLRLPINRSVARRWLEADLKVGLYFGTASLYFSLS